MKGVFRGAWEEDDNDGVGERKRKWKRKRRGRVTLLLEGAKEWERKMPGNGFRDRKL